ncbi:restriction endonuclease subunit S [Gordonia terrae]|uniref:restriction endonuclease subunit S n=1 Tax=Gordonia hongkongensis TaxID=1701090 RepID=UPI0022B2EF47|nr:restriction endonuclease subunit S [Gordonia terrae]
MTWVTVELGDVARLQAGYGFPVRLQGRISGDYPFAKVGDISRSARQGQGELDSATNYVDQDDLPRLKAKPVPAGSVLFAKIGEAIRQNYRVVNSVPVLIDNNAMAAIPTARINDRYLLRFLQSLDFYQYASSTTVPALRKSSLEQIKVPLPPLPEQRRIAAILDHADTLRAKRKQSLRSMDTLSRAVFVQMFGDPRESGANNLLGDVTEFYAGGTLPDGEAFTDQRGGYQLLKVSDLNLPGNETFLRTSVLWSAKGGTRAATCPTGSVVIPKRGGAIGTNKKRLTVRSTVLDPNLMGISPIESILTSEYLFQWFKFLDLASIQSGSSVPQLNKKDLSPLTIYLPDLAEQVEFGRRVAAVRSLANEGESAYKKCEALFSSIQSRAFRGEL